MTSLKFKYYLWRHQYQKALCQKVRSSQSNCSDLIWSLYQLGKYRSVIAHDCSNGDLKFFFSRAISFAACGLETEAKNEVSKLLCLKPSYSQIHRLSLALAPYLPRVALELLETQKIKVSSLHIALLIRNGSSDEAKLILNKAISNGEGGRLPELYLLNSNLSAGDYTERVNDLNRFLSTYNLSRVNLINDLQPPSSANLNAINGLKYIKSGPLVTVLMTTFNSAQRVDSAITSILGQTYRNLELLIIDDASTDGTLNIIRNWTLRDPRIRLISMGVNGGTYLAKNIGLQNANGDFVTCHDSDDWAHPEKIARQLRPLLQSSKLVASISSLVRLQDDGQYVARSVSPLMRINPSSLMFRRAEVLQKIGAWDCVRTGADTEFMVRMRLVFGRKSICRIREPLTFASHHPNSLTNAESTGFDSKGLSSDRLTYWEAWSDWHIDCLRKNIDPKMPSVLSAMALKKRPFTIPEHLQINNQDILNFLRSELSTIDINL